MLNYKSLRKRPSYDGVVDYLEHHQEIIKYPNRIATNDNSFNDEYEQLKQMRRMRLMNLHNEDKTTQTELYIDMGTNVNLKNYKELYEKALLSGDWHLEGGDVKNRSAWGEREIITMQTQTMVLEANRRYYQSNKFDKWFKPDRSRNRNGNRATK